ncbi:glycosyltransferase family 2 protein, partial [uncultured Muribaculum sp.]
MKIQHYQLNNEPIPKPISEFVKYKLPLLLYAPVSYTLSLIHRLRSTKHEFRHKVSLCLIFKDEEPYLKEWIDYHILIGVDHFYLYNNNSSDRF